MVDYLLRTGKHSAAASYAKERSIEASCGEGDSTLLTN